MAGKGFRSGLPDSDPLESSEWDESITGVIDTDGVDRARRLLLSTIATASESGVDLDVTSTPYQNSLEVDQAVQYPGDLETEKRLDGVIRWNAMMMVTRANKHFEGIGGHISTYASCSTLWSVGLNHFYRGKDLEGWGDHVYWQGHASPGIYARAFLEGRIDEATMEAFRQEVDGSGLSSYPHPRLMPEFWEYPSVSMGLGAMTAIHQSRFNRYLHNRGLADTSNSRVWYTMGDGEAEEPESLSQLALAAREGLDDIVMILNCNLQRLDGPVRGNGKIVQELEGRFRGAGWRVIKLLWGSKWDSLFSKDKSGILAARLEDLVDGDEQRILTANGAIIREELFNSDALKALVSHLDDSDLEELALNVGGHDMEKVYAAYSAAVKGDGRPTVILARTIKGYGLGGDFAGRNTTHQKKKADVDTVRFMRDDLGLEFSDEDLESLPYVTPDMVPDLVEYSKERRVEMGGPCPERRVPEHAIDLPGQEAYSEFDGGTRSSLEVSTTMAFVRLLRNLMKTEELGEKVVPIIPDEARTFGMDPLFAEFGIYHPEGQLYTPVDHKMLMKYKTSDSGQVIQEGINEAGATSTFIASGTSYYTQGSVTIPFYTFYSMFGFQRIGDLVWSAADSRVRGFLMGATSGRTTLNGEGLQHQDGHSLLLAHSNPAVRAYDPAFAYELATIIRSGIEEMYGEEKDVIYYVAIYNENYSQPEKPDDVDEGIVKGLYRITPEDDRAQVRLIGSGPIIKQVEKAFELLAEKGVQAEIWSATSYGELRREGLAAERSNRLSPDSERVIPWVEKHLGDGSIPTIAVSDNVCAVPDMVRQWVGGDFSVLGTDGFGRSDTRESLRRFFEIDAEHIALAALSSLVRAGVVSASKYSAAVEEWKIDLNRQDIAEI